MPITLSGTNGITFPDGNTQPSAVPEIGTIVFSTSTSPPSNNFLAADGAVVPAPSYPLLHARVAANSALRVSPNTAVIDRIGGVTAPAGTTYSADSVIDGGRAASAAFDGAVGDASGCWHTTNHGPPYWIRVTFTSPTRLNYWDWQKRPLNDSFPINWTLRGSNDGGSTYTTLYTKTGDGGVNSGSFNINTFTNANLYTTYEMNVTVSSGNAYCIVGEIRCGRIVEANSIALPNYSSGLPSGLYAYVKVK